MTRHSKIITVIFALILISLVSITPLFSTPSISTYGTLEDSNLSIDASSWFDQNQGQIFSNQIMLNLLPTNFSFSPSGIFSFRQDNQKKVQFGVYYFQLIEFNDTNQNLIFDEGDDIINNVSLDDFVWSFQQYNFSSSEVVIPLIGVKPPISVVFILHLYLKTKNVSLSDRHPYINVTVPGDLTVKTFVVLRGYNWTAPSGEHPYNSRMLALEMAIKSEVTTGNQKHMFQLSNGSTINSSNPMNYTSPIPSIPGTNMCNISLITQNKVTHGELYWFNKAIADGELKDLNSSFKTNGTSFNLYLSVPYYGSNTLVLDPSFSMFNAPSGDMLRSIQSLLFILPYLTPSTGLSLLFLLGVISTSALIIGVVYYLKRKRI